MFARSPHVLLSLLLLGCHSVYAQVPSSGCTLKSPLPAGAICGKTGNNPVYATKSVSTQQTLDSIGECKDLCLRRSDTLNFNYDSSSSLCTLSGAALDSITASSTSTVTFYDTACYDCPAACSQQAVGEDLLDNSGFDLSQKYIGPWSSSGIQDIRAGGYKGSNGSFSCTAGKTGKCTLAQSFTNCPTTVYKWSYNYKAASKKFDTFSATASFTEGGDISHSLKYPAKSPATTKWQTYTDLVQLNTDVTASALDFVLHPGKSAKGSNPAALLVDNIQIVPTTYVVGAEPGATNSLPGGAFESGTLAPWEKTKTNENVAITSPGLQGNYAVKWTIKNGATNPSFGLMQNLAKTAQKGATEPGKAYLFNVDFRNNLPQGSGVRPLLHTQFEIYTGNNDSVVNLHNVYTEHHSGQLGTVRIPFQGQANQFLTKFTITIASEVPSSGDNYLIIDNISFKPLARAS